MGTYGSRVKNKKARTFFAIVRSAGGGHYCCQCHANAGKGGVVLNSISANLASTSNAELYKLATSITCSNR